MTSNRCTARELVKVSVHFDTQSGGLLANPACGKRRAAADWVRYMSARRAVISTSEMDCGGRAVAKDSYNGITRGAKQIRTRYGAARSSALSDY